MQRLPIVGEELAWYIEPSKTTAVPFFGVFLKAIFVKILFCISVQSGRNLDVLYSE
jgi:hypothetical protein